METSISIDSEKTGQNQASLPPRLIGLDPSLSGNIRLFAHVAANLEAHSSIPGLWVYRGHPIERVALSGLVVSLEEKSKFLSIVVDDGTGLMPCIRWKEDDKYGEKINLGDFVDVYGRLTVFNGAKQVTISTHRRQTDANMETMRRLDTIKVLNNLQKPFEPSVTSTEI